MTTSPEARLNGHVPVRVNPGSRSPHSEACEPSGRTVASQNTAEPNLLAYAVCTGAVATLGGLAVAAVVRPSSPWTVWLLSTIALTIAGGVLAVPAMSSMERRLNRRGD